MNISATQERRVPAPQRWCLALAAVLGLVMLSGCGGGSGVEETISTAADEEGILYVTMTDAEGDFASYIVDVDSVLLERPNGTTVETLPLSTRIDFTDLTEVTEFLTIATVPAGTYVSASLQLDFSDAQIMVQDDNGNVSEAVAVDTDGNALGQQSVRLQLANSDVIRIAPGVPAAFSLDFDLDASNTIDFDADPKQVTVSPFLLATAELEEDREHRVRGVLATVDTAAATATLKVRPFFHRTGDFGRFTLNVDDETQYEIDGQGYMGADGLAVLATLAENTPVVANGSIAARQMDADIVIAGSSVPWADADVAKGVITARDGNMLTLSGARREWRDGRITFAGPITVEVGDLTTVTAPGVDNAALSIASISVGQRIVAFGEWRDDETLDASDGRVVMQFSQFTGEVAQVQPLAANVDLYNGRRTAVYDTSGTGVTEDLDADLDFYEIDTGSLSLNGIETGELIRVRGLVNAFGAAPADFNARTVIDLELRGRAGELKVQWPTDAPSAMPFLSTSAELIDVDITESREFLAVRGVRRIFTNPLDMLRLEAPESGRGAYAVNVRGTGVITLYRSFADLVAALDTELAAGSRLQRIHARVGYTGNTDALVTERASFVFRAADDVE